MKYLLFAVLLSACFTSMAQNAPEQKKSQEKRGLSREFLEKYDTNKDGKLDKDERAKISEEDKKKMMERRKRGPQGKRPERKSENK